MRQIVLVGEDRLCCALGTRLLAHALPGWALATEPIDTGGVTKLRASLSRYVKVARHGPAVLCIADTDQACAVECVRDWLPNRTPPTFMLRLAVREAESWILADRQAMADHFRVPPKRIPANPDLCDDPKQDLLGLLNRFAPAHVRREMVSHVGGQSRRGSGYNAALQQFVQTSWQPARAVEGSPSLRRAVRRLSELSSIS